MAKCYRMAIIQLSHVFKQLFAKIMDLAIIMKCGSYVGIVGVGIPSNIF
jgi:hypothetical protein